MNKLLFFCFFTPIFIIGCGGGSNQVFIPDVRSGAEATQSVFIPAVQSVETEATEESQAVPTAVVKTEPTIEATAPVSISQGTADADVLFVKVSLGQDSTWAFSVTVTHLDTGWEDYADGWDVLLPDGTVLKPDSESPFTRLLLHPHENEQPFTRSQGGIEIPPEIELVIVRAHDIVDGFGGREVTVNLTMDDGPDFEVRR